MSVALKAPSPRTRSAGSLLARLAAPGVSWERLSFFAADPRPPRQGGGDLPVREAGEEELLALRAASHPARPLEELRERFRRGERCWVAQALGGPGEGERVGSCWATRSGARIAEAGLDVLLRPHEAFFYDAYVRPEWRDAGAFGSLLRASLMRLAAEEVRCVHFCLRSDDVDALSQAARWADATGTLWLARRGGARCRLPEDRSALFPVLVARREP
ncbi:MAG TPA: hypothetical protein VF310_17410 [Vicinamibacteria bacterium]